VLNDKNNVNDKLKKL